MNQKEANQKILKIINKEDDLSQKKFELFKELMFQCDLKIQNDNGWTPLMYAFNYNQDENLNINEEQWNYLIKNSDLKQQNDNGWTPLMYALIYNKSQDLNLTITQWDYLIKNSDLNIQNKYGDIPLMYALIYNKEQDLNINEEKLNYLIKNSDLKQQNKDGWTHLFLALVNNKEQDLQLSSKQFKEMYNVLNEEQQQITFQNLIQENFENNQQYLEEINLFLYNLQFQPHEKTIHWLKENQHQDILEMIEKRDLFFQLNQTIKKIDNHQKIAIIKI